MANATHEATSALDRDHALELLRQMMLIRRFEERSAELYGLGKIRGFLHLYIGQEAVAVGVMQALRPQDSVVGSYRDHGQALARGTPAGALMAEMFGKAAGCCRGRGGSMHFFDAARRFFGGHAIVGAGIPVAVGLALADAMQRRPAVTACFFGDGAVAEGVFHESLNLAALWKLPVLFICENNLYAMGTALERHQSQTDLALKAQSYKIEAEQVDGMDVLAVEAATRRAGRSVRAGNGPRFIEAKTYRFRAHSMSDPELYRDKAEVAAHKRQDPIATFIDKIRDRDLATQLEIDEVEAAVARDVEQAVEFAEAGTWEPVEDLERDVVAARSP